MLSLGNEMKKTKAGKLRVVIADDEPLALLRLARGLEQADCEVVAKFQDGISLVSWLQENSFPDALFLDVKMPGATGLEILAEFQDRLPIVLVTSGSEFAVPAFDFAATDFLLKPVTPERLQKALDRIHVIIDGPKKTKSLPLVSKIPVIAGKGTVLLEVSKISHFELEGRQVWVWASGNRFETRWRSLAQTESALPKVSMVRLNRSIMVRPEAVRGLRVIQFGRRMVLLSDGKEYPASRRGSQALESVLGLA
jgi:two-component system, LytTR family, response regulator